MGKLHKLLAAVLIMAFISAAFPLFSISSQSDVVQVNRVITLGNASPEASTKGKPAPTSPDYKISINRGKTDIPITLTVYTANDNGLSATFVTNAIGLAAQEWDDATTADLLSKTPVVTGTKVAQVSLNQENAVFFANYKDSNVIAMASYWYNRATKEIVECDIMFNTYFQWGDATSSNLVMDLQNIATHELGHFFNLADLYGTSPTTKALTMYGYSWEGDVEKRTLDPGDIAGINAVFGT